MLRHLTMKGINLSFYFLWFKFALDNVTWLYGACLGSPDEKEAYGTCGQCEPCLRRPRRKGCTGVQKNGIACGECDSCRQHPRPHIPLNEGELNFLNRVNDRLVAEFVCPERQVQPKAAKEGRIDECGRCQSDTLMTLGEIIDQLLCLFPFVANRPPRDIPSNENTEETRHVLLLELATLKKKVILASGSFEPPIQAPDNSPETRKELEFQLKIAIARVKAYLERLYALYLKSKMLTKICKYFNERRRETMTDEFVDELVDKLVNKSGISDEYYDARRAYNKAFRMPLVLSAPLVNKIEISQKYYGVGRAYNKAFHMPLVLSAPLVNKSGISEDYYDTGRAYNKAFHMPLVLSAPLVLSSPAAPTE